MDTYTDICIEREREKKVRAQYCIKKETEMKVHALFGSTLEMGIILLNKVTQNKITIKKGTSKTGEV